MKLPASLTAASLLMSVYAAGQGNRNGLDAIARLAALTAIRTETMELQELLGDK